MKFQNYVVVFEKYWDEIKTDYYEMFFLGIDQAKRNYVFILG